jgi:hypothetical protein
MLLVLLSMFLYSSSPSLLFIVSIDLRVQSTHNIINTNIFERIIKIILY